MTINFAILGAGRIGQVHARAVTATPGARLVAISDPIAEAAGKLCTMTYQFQRGVRKLFSEKA